MIHLKIHNLLRIVVVVQLEWENKATPLYSCILQRIRISVFIRLYRLMISDNRKNSWTSERSPWKSIPRLRSLTNSRNPSCVNLFKNWTRKIETFMKEYTHSNYIPLTADYLERQGVCFLGPFVHSSSSVLHLSIQGTRRCINRKMFRTPSSKLSYYLPARLIL